MFAQVISAVLALSKKIFGVGNLSDGGISTVSVTAGVQFTSTGNVNFIFAGTNTPWLTRGAAADYEINVAAGVGGPLDGASAATGVWLSLGTSRLWQIVQAALGSKTWSSSYQVRIVSSGIVVGSGTIFLTAERSL